MQLVIDRIQNEGRLDPTSHYPLAQYQSEMIEIAHVPFPIPPRYRFLPFFISLLSPFQVLFSLKEPNSLNIDDNAFGNPEILCNSDFASFRAAVATYHQLAAQPARCFVVRYGR